MTKTRAKKGKEISKAGTGRGSINHDEKGNVVMGVSGTLTLFFFKKKRCTSSEACLHQFSVSVFNKSMELQMLFWSPKNEKWKFCFYELSISPNP